MHGSAPALLNGLQELLQSLVRRLPARHLARPLVHQIGNRVERILVMDTQVWSLEQELAQQPIVVLEQHRCQGQDHRNTHVYPWLGPTPDGAPSPCASRR